MSDPMVTPTLHHHQQASYDLSTTRGPPSCEQEVLYQSPIRGSTITEPEVLGHTTRSDALEEGLLQVKMSVGEVLDEFPRLRNENAALKASIERISACCTSNMSSLEVSVVALERSLEVEMEARSELERGLGKDLRDFVKSEMEHARDMVMREMRERMDGQKVLREEVQLQQQALASFTGRVDEAIIELRTELPRLGQESAAMKAEMEKLAAKHVACTERTERLEKRLIDESEDRCSSLKNLSKEWREHLAHEIHSANTQLAELRKQTDELSSRTEHSNLALAKDFREHIASENDRVMTQIAELKKLHNELRLRNDVAQNLLSKDLRDHMAVELERVTMQITELRRLLDEQGSRADESQKTLSKDLREHWALESKDLREHLLLDREQKEKEVAELRRLNNDLCSRMDTSHSTLSKDLREYVALEAERMVAQVLELKRPLDELGVRTDATEAAVKAVHEHVEQLSHDIAGTCNSVNSLEDMFLKAQDQSCQQTRELIKKLNETDVDLRLCVASTVKEATTELRSWVDTTVINRVSSLDRGLRTEMGERSSAIQQVVSKVSHNAERWCQLQAKVDEFLAEIHRASKPSM